MLVPSAGLIRLARESGVPDSSRALLLAAPMMDISDAAGGLVADAGSTGELAPGFAFNAAGTPPLPRPPPPTMPRPRIG